jgi:hypothetical protein
VVLASGYGLGAAGLITIAAIALVGLAAGLAWPASRRRLIARAWCVITPYRVRTGCRHARVQTPGGGRLGILYTTRAAFGERVALWCGAGITAGDLQAARDVLRAACWARDVRVVACPRYAHIVVLEVVRRLPAGPPPGEAISAWPYINPEEPAWSGGSGNHRPFR